MALLRSTSHQFSDISEEVDHGVDGRHIARFVDLERQRGNGVMGWLKAPDGNPLLHVLESAERPGAALAVGQVVRGRDHREVDFPRLVRAALCGPKGSVSRQEPSVGGSHRVTTTSGCWARALWCSLPGAR